MMFIDPAALSQVLNILGTHVPEYEVWAFGSRVHGRNLKPFSDLDLIIISTEPIDSLQLLDLKDAFIESDLPFKVDLLDWATVKDGFRRIIEQDHVVVKKALHGQE
jgi:predicted nucleotidyltransferase